MRIKFRKKTEPSVKYFVTLLFKVNSLRNLLYILSLILMVSAINQGFASTIRSTTEPNKNQEQQQGQEGRRKSDQTMMRPDGQLVGTSEITASQEESQSKDNLDTEQDVTENVDSLQDDSVSKYNFIFYFLYKFKYDSEESP